jgi:hypothetical protein
LRLNSELLLHGEDVYLMYIIKCHIIRFRFFTVLCLLRFRIVDGSVGGLICIMLWSCVGDSWFKAFVSRCSIARCIFSSEFLNVVLCIETSRIGSAQPGFVLG